METGVITRAYRGGKLVAQDIELGEVQSWLDKPDVILWIDLCGNARTHVRELGATLGLHELSIEDAMGGAQRPKASYFDGYAFVIAHQMALSGPGTALVDSEVDVFLHPRWCLTVRELDSFDIGVVAERWERSSALLDRGPGFILYALLDYMIDGYFDVVESLDSYFEDVSSNLFEDRPIPLDHQREWFETRRSLVKFKRNVTPMREAIGALTRREEDIFAESLQPYFQDLYDHLIRVTESIDSIRDLLTSIVETNLSVRDYRQNQVMKQVTSWAAIVAVPTLITGFYGMNVPYPGFNSVHGAWVSVALMVVLSGLLYAIFRSKDWL